MASKLNPAAPEFVPGIGSYVSDSFMSSASMDDVPEVIKPACPRHKDLCPNCIKNLIIAS
jgi:hypothetical protein